MTGTVAEGTRKGLMGSTSVNSIMKALSSGALSPRNQDRARLRSSSNVSSTCMGSEGDASDTQPAAASLERILRNLAAQPWPAARFDHINRLQDAARNQGSVELMYEKGGIGKVAVKKMPNTWMQSSASAFAAASSASSEQPWLDLAIVQWLNSKQFPYTCALHGIFQDSTTTYVVFDLATEGDLFGWCQSLACQGALREKTVRPVIQKLCSAVAWLHDLGIAHRDISLENVLLTKGAPEEGLKVKLIDFGMSTTQRPIVNEVRGKASYQAPEMHEEDFPYDPFMSDVFAVGVTTFCMATQDYPWTSTMPGSCQLWHFVALRGFRSFLGRRKLRKGKHGEFLSEALSAQFIELLEGLLTIKPRKRFTLGENTWGEDEMDGTKSEQRNRRSVWDTTWMNSWMA